MPKLLLKDSVVVGVEQDEFPVHPSLEWVEGVAEIGQIRQQDGTFTNPPQRKKSDIDEEIANADLDGGALAKTIASLFFDHENRIRSLEGNPPVTRQQTIDRMKTIYKSFL